MRINNQAKVGLVTVVCLLCQGYIFTYILRVEPHPYDIFCAASSLCGLHLCSQCKDMVFQ